MRLRIIQRCRGILMTSDRWCSGPEGVVHWRQRPDPATSFDHDSAFKFQRKKSPRFRRDEIRHKRIPLNGSYILIWRLYGSRILNKILQLTGHIYIQFRF